MLLLSSSSTVVVAAVGEDAAAEAWLEQDIMSGDLSWNMHHGLGILEQEALKALKAL
jgi:hypothetical protein